jgi:hypothetical protein
MTRGPGRPPRAAVFHVFSPNFQSVVSRSRQNFTIVPISLRWPFILISVLDPTDGTNDADLDWRT